MPTLLAVSPMQPIASYLSMNSFHPRYTPTFSHANVIYIAHLNPYLANEPIYSFQL
jgi:hypothetical protein